MTTRKQHARKEVISMISGALDTLGKAEAIAEAEGLEGLSNDLSSATGGLETLLENDEDD